MHKLKNVKHEVNDWSKKYLCNTYDKQSNNAKNYLC